MQFSVLPKPPPFLEGVLTLCKDYSQYILSPADWTDWAYVNFGKKNVSFMKTFFNHKFCRAIDKFGLNCISDTYGVEEGFW